MGTEQIVTSQSFTRPANTTGYTAWDIISNSATATTKMIFPTNFECGKISKIILKTDNPLFTGKVRLWLVTDSAYSVVGDNVSMELPYASTAEVAYFDFVMNNTGSGSAVCGVGGSNSEVSYKLPDKSNMFIYGFLQTMVSQTPTSGQKFTVTITMEKDY